MATVVKEKRREKRKTKDKSRQSDILTEETPINLPESIAIDKSATMCIERDNRIGGQTESYGENTTLLAIQNTTSEVIYSKQSSAKEKHTDQSISTCSSEKSIVTQNVSQPIAMECNRKEKLSTSSCLESTKYAQKVPINTVENVTDNYEYLNKRLEMIVIPELTKSLSEARELELSVPEAYLRPSTQAAEYISYEHEVESAIPSAPIFEEEIQPQISYEPEWVQEIKPKIQCMPLEEALHIFGGKEMAEVKLMSEKEEAIVEAGPTSSPEHPLVDLLSTFKSSLRALENESSRLTCAFADEDKSRSTLWKVEKRFIHQKKQCKCGAMVELKASYEHAQLLKERLPVAKLKLESMLRDIQDSYCHHQHAVLLAHCQIEELISETVESNTPAIREALSLILRALRMSDDSVAALPAALQRWAAALVAALLPERDVTQLVFVLHHLFRQSRSVRWAGRAFRPRVPDAVAAARALAVIDTLLASPRLDAALECTEEDADEGWEEVSVRGAGGAVSEGALREIDLLALLHAFPLRDLVARILQFTHSDIRQARPYEWGDARGGNDVMTACCGVRALLATMQRASDAHAQYARLRKKLRLIATTALEGLSCLYRSPRALYNSTLQEKIQAEMEACFVAAFNLCGTQDLHKLDTTLLADNTAKDYCLTFMIGLHDTSPREIDSMLVYAPVLPCSVRVRILSCAAQRRSTDHELARIVLDFLLQTGGKVDSPSATCKGGCGAAARAQLTRLLTAHAYLRTVALHAVADLAQVSTLDPLLVNTLEVNKWRPECEEMQAVLQDWAQRCPQLLHQLLLQLDCTPFTGLSLPVQLILCSWLCERQRSRPAEAEVWWRVLMRVRTARVCWRLPPDAPAPPAVTDLFSSAHALLAHSWGDSIPLICSHGVDALCALGVRPRTQVHCLAPVMLRMAHSPDSVSLTPRFGELFTSILNCGPTMVQRALGRGGVSGPELLLRLMLTQIEDEQKETVGHVSVFPAWLHGLWRVPLRAAVAALDTAALAARQWPALDAHANTLLQEENAKDVLSNAVRNASCAPLLCECLLRASHNRELTTNMFAALANILWEQRVNGQKIHVDNALQKIKAGISSEELVIYRCANAALVAPLQHPSHLSLWRLFFHLYLQRPPNNMRDTALPVGPLFFSGLIKSRTLTQLIKRLQETAAYHKNEADKYKTTQSNQPSVNRVTKSASITIEKGLLPELSIKDMTGETSDVSDCDSDLSEESEEDSNDVEIEKVDMSEADKKPAFNMACYHNAAERMVREMCGWLEDGDQVRASPHHADIARFIPEQALETAWRDALSRSRPPPSEELDEFPRPATPPATPPEQQRTPLDDAVRSIMRIKDKSGTRSLRAIKSPLEDVDVKNSNKLFDAVDKYLKTIEAFATEWASEVNRISSLDRALWELVCALRVPRPLPPAAAPCPSASTNKCRPLLFYIEEREWCISTGADRAIKENRSSWVKAVRALSRARPAAARTAAALHSIARRVRDKASAVSAAERVWRAAGAQAAHCAATRAALEAAIQILAERWIRHDADSVVQILSSWCSKSRTSLQQALCGALVSPRHIATHAWPRVYATLLHAALPTHARFSYLSKFEMHQWSLSASPAARRELLSALVAAQTQHGPAPAQEHSVLLELLGVHTAAVVNADEMPTVVLQFATLAADGKLPPRQWTHLVNAVDATCDLVPFDRLSQLLSELAVLWWRARELCHGAPTLAPHAEYVAAAHTRLVRALVASAQALSYNPERVGRCAWSAFSESWGAWIVPHPSIPALVPSLEAPGAGYSLMLHRALAATRETMAQCPGSEIVTLQAVFEWVCACHAACRGGARREGRVQASELLAAFAQLPWSEHQWFTGNCLNVATQVCASNDVELTSWCCSRWSGTLGATLLRDVTHDTLVPRLVALLYLFTGTPLPHARHILDEAVKLPWHKLPEPALGDASDRFFMTHHDPKQAYHDYPQFQVLLHASMLQVQSTDGISALESREKRARCVSSWCRAAAAPALHAHCAAHARVVLRTLTALAPHLEESSGELEDLLGRASVVMCMEPAAAVVLPVWQQWVESTSPRVMRACVTAASALTAPAHCALLSDCAVRAYLSTNESSWSEVVSRWRGASPWREPQELVSRACLHAAYACAAAFQPLQRCRPPLHALQAATLTLDFVSNEAIIAVWICYACRGAQACGDATRGEGAAAARALLLAWAQPARRSLLQVVTLQPDTARPTPRHRVLCRMALCILAPSAEATQAYEQACVAAGGCDDVITWARSPRPALLPRLAAALYPASERLFTGETAE